jgi:hypothetical protein
MDDLERERLAEEYYRRPGPYKVMPRDINAEGLNFQAGIYLDNGGSHGLIAEVYTIEMAERIAAALNEYEPKTKRPQ